MPSGRLHVCMPRTGASRVRPSGSSCSARLSASNHGHLSGHQEREIWRSNPSTPSLRCRHSPHGHGHGHDHHSHDDHRHDHDHHCCGGEHGHQHDRKTSQVHSHSHAHDHHDHDHHLDHDHEHDHAHHHHGHAHRHSHSHVHSGHDHGHHHHSHRHGHDHHCCHHDHFEESAVSRALSAVGILGISSRIMHSGICTAISVACFITALMSTKFLAPVIGQAQATAVQTVALTATFLLSGFPQTVESICIAASGKIDTHVLMSLAAIGTAFMGMAHEGALLLLLFQLSHMLEEKFTMRARGGLEHLFASIPSQATQVELDRMGAPLLHAAVPTRAAAVQPGQHVLVKPGEQVPLDGRVVYGTASVSMQHISGESQPIRMQEGSIVPAGSLNIDGLLVVRVTASTDDSTPARIARMTQAAQGAKPKLQRTLDRVGEVWSKAVIVVTLATVAILPMFGVPLLGAHGALYRAMGVLTAGSPCALVLVPLAYICAISTVTRKGVLMKSAAALDLLHQCSTVALDKTGTLTTGSLTLTDVQVLRWTKGCAETEAAPAASKKTAAWQEDDSEPRSPDRIHAFPSTHGRTDADGPEIAAAAQAAMQYCLSLSVTSNHPVSRAVVVAGASMAGNEPQRVSSFEQVPGMGVRGECQLHPDAKPMLVRFGSLEFIKDHLPKDSRAAQQLQEAEARMSSAKAMSFLTVTPREMDASAPSQQGAAEPALAAMFCFEDVVDPGAPAAVAALSQGTWRSNRASSADAKEVVMLTGDGQQVAQQVASQLQISRFHAGLKPDDKLSYVTSFRDSSSSHEAANASSARSTGLLMMGDGINDAPALAAAHVGVAVASRPDDMVAAAADIIVLNGYGVANLPWLFKMAHKTQSVIRENLALALLSVVFATLPTVAGLFPLWLAVTLHEGATLLVALNSLRLLQDPQTSSAAQAIASSVAAAREMFAGGQGSKQDAHGHEHSDVQAKSHVPHLVHN